jgi:2-(1,2-epoxy-1,2-dihydrophenyl)acetyl-CoA isomerase
VEIIQNGAYIKLNRPEVFNSFNRKMSLEMLDVLENCEQDASLRLVVLSGMGKAFSAGQDLLEANDPNGPGLETIVREHYNAIILKLRGLQKPVLACLNGIAAGAGANIALACDIIIAKESASLLQAFSKIGLIPDSGGTYLLPRIVGFHRAAALCMTGDKISAQEAMQMGMIYKVFKDEEFDTACIAFANQLASLPTQALVLTKQLLNKTYQHTLEEQLENELTYQKMAAQTFDFNEGVQAFLEKRKPKFEGR